VRIIVSRSAHRSIRVTLLTNTGIALMLTVLLLLSACSPAHDASENSAAATPVRSIDQMLLPNAEWQVSQERLQLSFCRNLTNEQLLAEREELRRWRLSGEATAFPPTRARGLAALEQLYTEHDILLWQESGTVSSQFYRVITPTDYEGRSIFTVIAVLNQVADICYIALDDIN